MNTKLKIEREKDNIANSEIKNKEDTGRENGQKKDSKRKE